MKTKVDRNRGRRFDSSPNLWYDPPMKGPDLDRERSEMRLTIAEFLKFYNDGLPEGFPRASTSVLKEFCAAYPDLFKSGDSWSLDQHRKKLMDWLPMHVRSMAQ